jgi:hypothetical protein
LAKSRQAGNEENHPKCDSHQLNRYEMSARAIREAGKEAERSGPAWGKDLAFIAYMH